MNNLISKTDITNIADYKVTDEDCAALALKAKVYGFNTVVVGASSLEEICRYIKPEDNINIAVTVSYPSGAHTAEAKVWEIEELKSLNYKLHELYVVMAVGRFLSGDIKETENELLSIKKAAGGLKVKLVIEAGLFNKEQKKMICDLASKAGIEYIVTSSDFTPYDVPAPDEEDIKEMIAYAKPKVKIVAACSIDSKEKALRLIELGADRVLTSNVMEMVQ